jgi:hypothetical protein
VHIRQNAIHPICIDRDVEGAKVLKKRRHLYRCQLPAPAPTPH